MENISYKEKNSQISRLQKKSTDSNLIDFNNSSAELNRPQMYRLSSISPNRRDSFIYRQDGEYDSSLFSARVDSYADHLESLYSNSLSDEAPIVTPFAQILASLRRVRISFIALTKLNSSCTSSIADSANAAANMPSSSASASRFQIKNLKNIQSASSIIEGEDVPEQCYETIASDTLTELEWCLEQLESIQTHRSVSDMATNKFKRLLNKELSQFSDNTKSGIQVSQYICSTFMGEDSVDSNEDSLDDDTRKRKTNKASCTVSGESGLSTSASAKSLEESACSSSIDSQHDKKKFSKSSTFSSESPNIPVETSSIHPVLRSFSRQASTGKSPTQNSSTAIHPFIRGHNRPTSSLSSSIKRPVFDLVEEELPEYGVSSQNSEELAKLIEENIDNWGIDIFQLHKFSSGHPLTVVLFTIVKKRGLCNTFKIDLNIFHRYLTKLEAHYHDDVPYHNSIHAADVTQSTHVLLLANALEDVFTELEIFAALFACAIHDVNHPGLTNQYLINTNDPLALLYNDSSVLENHHIAVAFSLLQEEGCDIFASLTKKQRQIIRKMTIDMVLATDMSKHMSLLADLKTMVETKKVAGSGVLNLENYNEKLQILQNMVHCADLSNPTKPLELYKEWTNRIMEEFFRQGDKERAKNIEISPMCDRETATIAKSQVSFIDFIAHPLWETWADLVYPDAQNIFDTLQGNRDWFLSECQSDITNSNL